MWYSVNPKKNEPERQTHEIMWRIAKGADPQQAYREWYAREQKISSLIYPVIHNERGDR
jgi:hypothetical protein